MTPQLIGVLVTLLSFYSWLIIAYAVLTWFEPKGILYDIRRVLDTVVGPFLAIFRFIPPIGAVDISPLVAYFVVRLLIQVLSRLS